MSRAPSCAGLIQNVRRVRMPDSPAPISTSVPGAIADSTVHSTILDTPSITVSAVIRAPGTKRVRGSATQRWCTVSQSAQVRGSASTDHSAAGVTARVA